MKHLLIKYFEKINVELIHDSECECLCLLTSHLVTNLCLKKKCRNISNRIKLQFEGLRFFLSVLNSKSKHNRQFIKFFRVRTSRMYVKKRQENHAYACFTLLKRVFDKLSNHFQFTI